MSEKLKRGNSVVSSTFQLSHVARNKVKYQNVTMIIVKFLNIAIRGVWAVANSKISVKRNTATTDRNATIFLFFIVNDRKTLKTLYCSIFRYNQSKILLNLARLDWSLDNILAALSDYIQYYRSLKSHVKSFVIKLCMCRIYLHITVTQWSCRAY